MPKKTRKKRKISPVKRALRKKNLATNFIIILLLIFSFLAIGYFFFDEDIQELRVNKSDNILKEQKRSYTNEEVMEEVLASLNRSKQQASKDIPKDISTNTANKFDDKKQAQKETLKKDTKDYKDISILPSADKKPKEIKKETPKNPKIAQIKKEPIKEIEEEIIQEEKSKKEKEKTVITKKDIYKHNQKIKPKLIIIIDDVVSQVQKDKILSIGYPITISFLPPTKDHPNSAKIAQDLSSYMIHFPLQATSAFKNFEENTLNITDSYKTIENRVKQLRAWYPKAVYTNNHTGSAFTSSFEAMNKLFRALKKYNFIFVDSKTSVNSTAKELSVKHKVPYIVRDIFLDNDRNFTYIQNQLKLAIKTAKKQGYAIAIGHPYDITFKVLKESKHLLKEVEPVFINQLPYL